MNFTTQTVAGFYMNEVPQGLGITIHRHTSKEALGMDIDLVCKSIELHVQAFNELKMTKDQMHKYITKTIQQLKKSIDTKNVIQFLAAVEYMEQNGMMPVNDTNGMCYMRGA